MADEAQGEQARDRSEERRLTCHPKPSAAIKSQSEVIKSQSELIKSQSDSPAPERPTMATWSPAPIEIVSRCIVGRPCGGYDS